jgi:hypothetical protein
MRQFRLTGLFMCDEQQIDHPAAGVPPWQVPLQHLPRFGVFCPGEQAVAVDRTPQGLWLAPQGMDHVMVVDDMDAMPIVTPAGAGMADDQGAAEKRLDAVIVEVDAQTLPDQL